MFIFVYMSQKPIQRSKPLAHATKRKNFPKHPRIKNAVVKKLADKQAALTIKKIENSVGSSAGQEAGALNLIRIDKQLIGQLNAAKKGKK